MCTVGNCTLMRTVINFQLYDNWQIWLLKSEGAVLNSILIPSVIFFENEQFKWKKCLIYTVNINHL